MLRKLLASWAFSQEAWAEQASVRQDGLRDGQACWCVSALNRSKQLSQSPVYLIRLYVLQILFRDGFYAFCYFLRLGEEKQRFSCDCFLLFSEFYVRCLSDWRVMGVVLSCAVLFSIMIVVWCFIWCYVFMFCIVLFSVMIVLIFVHSFGWAWTKFATLW